MRPFGGELLYGSFAGRRWTAWLKSRIRRGSHLTSIVGNLVARARGAAWLMLTLAILFWAGNVIAARVAVGQISPGAMVCLRWTIVSLVLLVIARDNIRQDWPKLLPHWRSVILMGMFGYTIYNVLYYEAGVYTTGVNLSILQCSTPVFVLLGGRLIYGTPLTLVRSLGLTLTIIGGLLVATRGDLTYFAGFEFNLGDLFITIASVFYGFYTLALRSRPPVSALGFFSAMAFVAFLTSLPALAIEVWLGATIWPTFTGALALLYVAIFPSLLAQLLYMRGVELIGPNRAGLFYNLLPVVGALLSVVLLGEPFRSYHAMALALVLTGIFLSERLGSR